MPSPQELLAAAGRTIPDVLAPGLDVVFCGINPGLWSAWSGHHFARPGNRFWPALHRGGFTPRQLLPAEQDDLPGLGLGITNVVERGSARAAELTRHELRAGGEEYGLPSDATVEAQQQGGRMEAHVSFTRDIPLPGYVYKYSFDHTVKSSAFLSR